METVLENPKIFFTVNVTAFSRTNLREERFILTKRHTKWHQIIGGRVWPKAKASNPYEARPGVL